MAFNIEKTALIRALLSQKNTHVLRAAETCPPAETGCIPETVGDLNRLTSLRLSHNRLSGRIPASLTRLASLTALDLARNAIGGTIPTKMGTMTTLRKLSLGCNKVRSKKHSDHRRPVPLRLTVHTCYLIHRKNSISRVSGLR